MKKWTPFWWESNAAWGVVDSPEAWDKMVDKYQRNYSPRMTSREIREQMIDSASIAVWKHASSFEAGNLVSVGCRREHFGGQPFKQWLIERDMYDIALGPETLKDKLLSILRRL